MAESVLSVIKEKVRYHLFEACQAVLIPVQYSYHMSTHLITSLMLLSVIIVSSQADLNPPTPSFLIRSSLNLIRP